jgi:sterol desaturase/sphingolipid hydroxylase (fatty acid hydroxylase superfamily)
MTLSGKSDRQERMEAARAARQERATMSAAKRPWLMPVIVSVAVVVLVGAVVYAAATGVLF